MPKDRINIPNSLKSKINLHLEKLKLNKFWFQSLPWDGYIAFQSKSRDNQQKPDQNSYFTGIYDTESDPKLQKKKLEN